MPAITENKITFTNEEDFETVRKYMDRITPDEGIYTVTKIYEDKLFLANLAEKKRHIVYIKDVAIDNINFYGSYTPLTKCMDKIQVGDIIQRDHVLNTTKEHYVKLRASNVFQPRFNFNAIVPVHAYDWEIDKNLDGNMVQPNDSDKFWFNANTEAWGTKWNAMDAYWDEDEYSVSFQTAWTDVEPLIEKLANKFPGIEMEYEYVNEGDEEYSYITYNEK